MKLKTHVLTCVTGRRGAMAFCISRENQGTLDRRAFSLYAVKDKADLAKNELVRMMKEYGIPHDCQWREYTDMSIDFYSKSDRELEQWCGTPPERNQWQKQNWRTSYAGHQQKQGGNGNRMPANGSSSPADEPQAPEGIEVPLY